MSEPFLPALPADVRWSINVLDGDGDVLAESGADRQCETASVGKLFLLIEVASRLESGALSPDERICIPDDLRVEDSGLLYRMRDQRLTIADAALLVGAVSDNLATNALLHRCGLDVVRARSRQLGYRDTGLLDYIRDERTPDMPWAPSCGTARDLSDLLHRLSNHEVVSSRVSAQVMEWLAADTDTSMVASALLVDPLAHVEPDDQGIVLRHKTGTTSRVRADVGWVQGPAGSLTYAVCANWDGDVRYLVPVMTAMRRIGERLRDCVTGDPS
ncbi:MAG: serine hydrolase [Pseudoclavibacter sp.]